MSTDVRGRSWYHTIDLADGTSTPGVFDHRVVATRVQWPEGLRGGRCLDVGTCDGFWAFEMERRGAAEVVAVDLDDDDRLDGSSDDQRGDAEAGSAHATARGRKFEIARAARGSGAKRIGCSVYDLDPDIHVRFDVVFCGALLLHLRDPVGALERMRAVCSGELVLLECVDAWLDLVAPRVPCAHLSPIVDQWWRVNSAGLRQLLTIAGFDVVWVGRPLFAPFGSWRQWRPKASARSILYSLAAPVLRRHPDAPVLARAAGLALSANLLPVRARPRSDVAGRRAG